MIAGGLALALVLAILVGMSMRGGEARTADNAVANTTDRALAGTGTPAVDADATPRDVTSLTTDSAAATPAGTSGDAPRRSASTVSATPTPLPWQQEVIAHPEAPVQLNPLASDWSVEQLVIGKDMAGKFLGRVNVRYSGPGSAFGKFEVVLLRDGHEITRLVGEIAGEVRAGTYPVILSSDASYVDGPWTTQFRVVSTS